MSAAIQATTPDLRTELINWRERLEASDANSADTLQLGGILREVKAAIERLTHKTRMACVRFAMI